MVFYKNIFLEKYGLYKLGILEHNVIKKNGELNCNQRTRSTDFSGEEATPTDTASITATKIWTRTVQRALTQSDKVIPHFNIYNLIQPDLIPSYLTTTIIKNKHRKTQINRQKADRTSFKSRKTNARESRFEIRVPHPRQKSRYI